MISALILAVTLTTAPINEHQVAANGCARHGSETTPPRTIRVRLTDRLIVRVPFLLYVARVVSSEWNTVPTELRKAGALAVKQYAWYKAMHPRRSTAGCFDVWDDTRDQIYRVKSPPAYVWEAVAQTWPWRILRDGRLFQTGYRTGRPVACARDVTGWKLFARSATRCANAGWSAARILTTYYDGRLVR